MERKLGWALVGTGSIVEKFLAGLREAEGVGNVCVVSRMQERADTFARTHGLNAGYAKLSQALADPAVDVVYIGTPHNTHRELVLEALAAKKAVLCEKPVCVAAWEMEAIAQAAQANHTFFMEAMWTRYMPAIVKVREWIAQGQIGQVKLVQANFGFRAPWEPEGRLLNPQLAGGALLDAGIYPVAMASMAFAGAQPTAVHGMMTLGQTGVDEDMMSVVSYGDGRMASLNASVRTRMQSDAWIYGDQGYIHMPDFVFGHAATLNVDGRFTYPFHPDVRGNGYTYEAEEVMRCMREGKLESAVMPIAESLQNLRLMDEIRRQGGLRYPFER